MRKDHRSLGIGKIFNKAMEHLQANNNGCMDLDHNFVEHYRGKGFVHKSFKFNCFQGKASDKCRIKNTANIKCNITEVSHNELPLVLDYDRMVYKGLIRERILRACLFGEHVYSVAGVCCGKVVGYGSLIMCTTTNNYSVCSLFADNYVIVDKILEKLLEVVPNGAYLTIQLVTDKQLPERFHHLEYTFQMQRVFNKYKIETDLQRVYFVNDFML